MEKNKINFLTEGLYCKYNINSTSRVSAHPYNPTALSLIAAVERKKGMALDCGAGLRDFQSEHLIQTEIIPHPNVDILCVNQELPFNDNSFDLILSIDVLEHVTDPFLSSSEISRVLKPGGILFIDLPFLQNEHGYPHHYFNATLEGVRVLFKDLNLKAQVVPAAGHPGCVVWFMLNAFQGGIDKKTRAKFHALTVGEILNGGVRFLLEQFGSEYKASAKRIMAGTSASLFVKPGEGGNILDVDIKNLPSFLEKNGPEHVGVWAGG